MIPKPPGSKAITLAIRSEVRMARSSATMTAGLLSAMLVDAYDTEQATRIIDYRLGHLFAG
jgi:hypothetical protein